MARHQLESSAGMRGIRSAKTGNIVSSSAQRSRNGAAGNTLAVTGCFEPARGAADQASTQAWTIDTQCRFQAASSQSGESTDQCSIGTSRDEAANGATQS